MSSVGALEHFRRTPKVTPAVIKNVPKTCYWDQSANGGLGKCDEAEEVEAAELPGLLRSTHQTKQTSSPSVWMYVGVFLGTFFITAGVTFGVLRKCSNAPTEDINMSYRAVV
jgi:hypothetical protein